MSETKKIFSVGIVGLGRAGYCAHAKELAEKPDKFRVVAGCDPLAEFRERLAKETGAVVYEEIDALLADPNVDIVSVATRSVDHFAHAKAALASGKHVVLEKPICVTYKEAKALKKVAAAAKGKLFIRHNRRFDPDFLKAKEIVASGVLGTIFEIKLTRWGYSRRDDWQTLLRNGGGQCLNWGPHIVDHALRLLESPVKEIWSDLKRVAGGGDAEDHVKIVLKGENGRVVDIEISGGAALPGPAYTFLGDRGAMTSVPEGFKLRYIDPEQKLRPVEVRDGAAGAYASQAETPRWIETTVPAVPDRPSNMWDEVYNDLTGADSYPIALDEIIEVCRILDAAKKNTPFA